MRPTHQTGDVHGSMTRSYDVRTAAAPSNTAVSGVTTAAVQHSDYVTLH